MADPQGCFPGHVLGWDIVSATDTPAGEVHGLSKHFGDTTAVAGCYASAYRRRHATDAADELTEEVAHPAALIPERPSDSAEIFGAK